LTVSVLCLRLGSADHPVNPVLKDCWLASQQEINVVSLDVIAVSNERNISQTGSNKVKSSDGVHLLLPIPLRDLDTNDGVLFPDWVKPTAFSRLF
jgi:hypothetical protein